MNDTFTRSDFLTTVVLLATASAVLVGLAYLLMRGCSAARLRTVIGRTALLSIGWLVLAELTGGLAPLQMQLRRLLVHHEAPRPDTSLPPAPDSLVANQPTNSSLPTVAIVENGVDAEKSLEDECQESDEPVAFAADDVGASSLVTQSPPSERPVDAAEELPSSDIDASAVKNDESTVDVLSEIAAVDDPASLESSVAPMDSLDQPADSSLEVEATGDVGPGKWITSAWWHGLVTIWFIGWTMLMMRAVVVRLGWSWRYRQAVKLDNAELRDRVSELSRQFGYRRVVTLKASSQWQGPVAWGIVSPTIGLPDDFCREFDAQQQRAMLAHELGHLASRDPLWSLVADMVTAALWWTPWCWWLRATLRNSAESAADEACLVIADGPRILAECLVVLGRRMTRPTSFGYAATGGFRSSLGKRVERLLELEQTETNGSLQGTSRQNQIVAIRFALVISVIVTMVGAAWARPGLEHSYLKEGKPMSWFDSTWRKSLLGSLVAMTLVTGNAPVGDTQVASAEEPQETAESEQEGEAEERQEADGEEEAEVAEEKEEEEAEATAEVADEDEASEDDDEDGDDEDDDDEEEEDEDVERDTDAEEAVRLEAEARAEAMREQIEEELEAKVAEIEESVERSTEQVVDDIAMLADRMAQDALVKADQVAAQADEIAELAAQKAEEAIARASEYLEEKEGSEKEKGEKAIEKGREKVKELKERIKSKTREKMAGRKKLPLSHGHESEMQVRKARMSQLEQMAMQLEKQRLQIADQMEMLARQQEKISMEIERVHLKMSKAHELGPRIDTSELERVAEYLDEQGIKGFEVRWLIGQLRDPMREGIEHAEILKKFHGFAEELRSHGKEEEARRLEDAIDSVMTSIKAQHDSEDVAEERNHHQAGEEVTVLREQMEAMRAEMKAMREMLQQQAKER